MKKMQGMITGILLGATAASIYGMTGSRTRRRIGRAAAHAGKQLVGFAEDLFGR